MDTPRKTLNTVGQSIQRAINAVLDAAKRVFSPNDDDYPATGVQPFEGDISGPGQS